MKTLASVAALIALAAPAFADDKETLSQAISKAAALESYAFKGETEVQSPFGNAPPQVPTMDGKYQKDTGLHIKSDKGEVFKKGERVFVKQGSGAWQDLAQFQPPAPAEGDKPNRNRARGTLFGRMMLKNFKAPHEELQELAKGFKEVKKGEKIEKIGEIECTQFSGDLSEDAMKGSPLGRMLGQFGAAGNAETKGSARVWVDGSGNVVVYEVLTKISIDIQGNQVDITMTRRCELSDAGKVKVDVPEAVQKLMSEKPKTEEKKE
jgi:3D (Asp-Asp-Asp) domain-containing protein